MDRFSRLCLFLAAAASLAAACQAPVSEPLKPRIVVLTDIGPAEVEPDDNESAVRLLSYADRFEIEGLITTIGWNCDPYPEEWAEYLFRVIDGYEVDVNNLMKRSGQTGFRSPEEEQGAQALGYWPSAGYLRSRAVMGSTRAGIGVIGEGNDSPGSELLIRLADEDDPRPIWVCSWGGANTLSQAIWKVQQTRSAEELKAFLRKFRLYTITDQDMVWAMRMDRAYSSHQWLRREFADDLLLVWDESAWLNQNALGVQNWDKYAALIQGHGEMGKVYPHYLWGVEGDTPSFLNVMPNGLNDPERPEQVGWGGCHQFGLSPDRETSAWTNWQEPLKGISSAYEHHAMGRRRRRQPESGGGHRREDRAQAPPPGERRWSRAHTRDRPSRRLAPLRRLRLLRPGRRRLAIRMVVPGIPRHGCPPRHRRPRHPRSGLHHPCRCCPRSAVPPRLRSPRHRPLHPPRLPAHPHHRRIIPEKSYLWDR